MALTYQNPSPTAYLRVISFWCLKTFTKVTEMVLFSTFNKLFKMSWHQLPRQIVQLFYRHQGGHCLKNHIRLNGTYATGHTHANGQFNMWWHPEHQNTTKTLQGNGHTVLLVEIYSFKNTLACFVNLQWETLGGYFTKHHLPEHHKVIIPVYLQCPTGWSEIEKHSHRITVAPTCDGILNITIKQKRSEAMDIRFYWLRYIVLKTLWRVL